MRYQDWDVLVFSEASHIPIQEFRTACFLVQEGVSQTPTLVSYIPSLPTGAPFTISLHSWTQPQASPSTLFYKREHHSDTALGVRVVVDGICVSNMTFPFDTSWPQVAYRNVCVFASDGDAPLTDQTATSPSVKRQGLFFPGFNRTILSRRDWDIKGDIGRIKVFIFEGFRTQGNLDQRFHPVRSVVCFAFHPAPLEYLERCNIAWPNPNMWKKPWYPGMSDMPNIVRPRSALPAPGQYTNGHQSSTLHDSGIDILGSSMGPPPPPGQLPFLTSTSHPFPEMHSLSSRSTSENSLINSVVPEAHRPVVVPKTRSPQEFRLPSDQLRQLVAALKPTVQVGSLGIESYKDHLGAPQAQMIDSSSPLKPYQFAISDEPNHEVTGRHQRFPTDTSMHTACTGFPECITDDPESGLLVHSTPAAWPVQDLDPWDNHEHDREFRKVSEASAKPTAIKKTKKRTRSALSQLEVNAVLPEQPQQKTSKTGLRSSSRAAVAFMDGAEATVVDDMVA